MLSYEIAGPIVLSKESQRKPHGFKHNQPLGPDYLIFDVDRMDQAKFRCPRNISMHKQFADMWRPQLGAGGVTMGGIGLLVCLTDFDLEKSADVQLTLI